MDTARPSPAGGVIELHLRELKDLFDPLDPGPFWNRDLQPRAAEFIVEAAEELPAGAAPRLVVHLEQTAGTPEERALVRAAVRAFFHGRALDARRRLRRLLRIGRVSLLISLAFLALMIAAGDAAAGLVARGRLGEILREGFVIGGWVAMWRPLEIFLYDWWPVRGEMRLLRRLAEMPVDTVRARDEAGERPNAAKPVGGEGA